MVTLGLYSSFHIAFQSTRSPKSIAEGESAAQGHVGASLKTLHRAIRLSHTTQAEEPSFSGEDISATTSPLTFGRLLLRLQSLRLLSVGRIRAKNLKNTLRHQRWHEGKEKQGRCRKIMEEILKSSGECGRSQ